MRCAACGDEARGRILVEMWHGHDGADGRPRGPGFAGWLVRSLAWSCGRHAVPLPSDDDARYFAQRFIVENMRPPPEGIRVGAGFVAMNETEGRELDQSPEAIYRRQIDGTSTVTIEGSAPAEWAELQKRVRAREALLKSRGPLSALRGKPSPT
jgi:hypothetical protein